MENDRITIRLPQIDLRQIDLLIRLGEFTTRSEVVRHAVKEYIENHTTRILAKADKYKKIQELEAAAAAIEPYMKNKIKVKAGDGMHPFSEGRLFRRPSQLPE